MGVIEWKRYLSSHGLDAGNIESNDIDSVFIRAILKVEGILAKVNPLVEGMIWRNGKLNSLVTINDVDTALKCLGVADFDSLGPPNDPEFIGTPFKQLFISQEDSKLNETDPRHNQNQGNFQVQLPIDAIKTEPKITTNKTDDIEKRMKMLMLLMDQIEK